MQGTPNTMQKNPKYFNVLLDIYDFFEKIEEIKENQKIIIDPGIGFGKKLKHNLILISNIFILLTWISNFNWYFQKKIYWAIS